MLRFNRHYRFYGLREPDWRWWHALDLSRGEQGPGTRRPGTYRPGTRDLTVRRLAEFLAGGKDFITDPNSRYRFTVRPLLAIHDDWFRRLSLESRVLAYRDPALAAKACGIKTATVENYCLIFFDVLDRLDAPRAIDAKVIHDKRHAGDHMRRDLYCQAYRNGPIVLEHWLEHLPYLGQQLDHDLDTPEGIERERLELALAASHQSTAWKNPRQMAAYDRVIRNQTAGTPFSDLVAEYQATVLQRLLASAPESAQRTVSALCRAA